MAWEPPPFILQPLLAQADQEERWLVWLMLSLEKTPLLLPEPLQMMADICPSLQGALEVLQQKMLHFCSIVT